MNKITTTDQLVVALNKAGFRLTRSKLLNVRTGKRWYHRRVISRTGQVSLTIPKKYTPECFKKLERG